MITLHPATEKLIDDFAAALKEKLLASQEKYLWSDDWTSDGWQSECQAELRRHVLKGDPRDVAAYCAFAWFHSWPTAVSAETDGASELKKDPAYAEGYFDAVDGRTERVDSAAYAEGFKAGESACELLASHGFKKRGRTFSHKLVRS